MTVDLYLCERPKGVKLRWWLVSLSKIFIGYGECRYTQNLILILTVKSSFSKSQESEANDYYVDLKERFCLLSGSVFDGGPLANVHK
jgi:hypothetical protein